MKKKLILCVAGALCLATMSGCTSLYHTQLADVPMIDHKGDIRLSLNGYATEPYSVGSTITIGVTDALAIQLHGNTDLAVDKDFYSHFAVGLFKPIGNTLLEGYAALGRGSGENWNGADIIYTAKGHYVLPFLQLNYGVLNVTKAHIDAGIAIKIGVMVPDFTIYYYNNNNDEIVVYANYQTSNLLLEPQLFFRIGGEHVKYTFQMGYSYLSDMYNFNDRPSQSWGSTLYYKPFSASLGLIFYL